MEPECKTIAELLIRIMLSAMIFTIFIKKGPKFTFFILFNLFSGYLYTITKDPLNIHNMIIALIYLFLPSDVRKYFLTVFNIYGLLHIGFTVTNTINHNLWLHHNLQNENFFLSNYYDHFFSLSNLFTGLKNLIILD